MSYEEPKRVSYEKQIEAYRNRKDVEFYSDRRKEETEFSQRRLAEIKKKMATERASPCQEMRRACEERRRPDVCEEDEDFRQHCGHAKVSKRRPDQISGENKRRYI